MAVIQLTRSIAAIPQSTRLRHYHPRRPGLDPGSRSSVFSVGKEGGCRVEPGMTIENDQKDHFWTLICLQTLSDC
jgi:hypothetical protein